MLKRAIGFQSLWIWLVLVIVITLVFQFRLIPDFSRYSEKETLLDSRCFYTPAEAYGSIGKYAGNQAWEVYLYRIIPLDMLYAVTYTMLFLVAGALILRRLFSPDSPWQNLCLVPLIAGTGDYTENISIAVMLYNYTVRLDAAAWLASAGTVLKWSFIYISGGLVLLGLIVLGVRALKQI